VLCSSETEKEVQDHLQTSTTPPETSSETTQTYFSEVNCLNCVHNGDSLDPGDFCQVAGDFIEDPEQKISCQSFQRKQCKDCGFYEDSFCVAKDGEIAKDPEEECEFDIREFM
jgi:hypothetical protein